MFIADMPLEPPTTWTQDEAISLCVQIEDICPRYGCHVALTGGCLYKNGRRKDLDLIFYKHDDVISVEALLLALEVLGIKRVVKEEELEPDLENRWCIKALKGSKKIDLLFPHAVDNDYEG